jgi:hypothetical protein
VQAGAACVQVKTGETVASLKQYRGPLRDLITLTLDRSHRDSEIRPSDLVQTLLFDLRFCDAESAGDLVAERVIIMR